VRVMQPATTPVTRPEFLLYQYKKEQQKH